MLAMKSTRFGGRRSSQVRAAWFSGAFRLPLTVHRSVKAACWGFVVQNPITVHLVEPAPRLARTVLCQRDATFSACCAVQQEEWGDASAPFDDDACEPMQRRPPSGGHRRSIRSMPGAEPSMGAPIMSALSLPPMVRSCFLKHLRRLLEHCACAKDVLRSPTAELSAHCDRRSLGSSCKAGQSTL